MAVITLADIDARIEQARLARNAALLVLADAMGDDGARDLADIRVMVAHERLQSWQEVRRQIVEDDVPIVIAVMSRG